MNHRSVARVLGAALAFGALVLAVAPSARAGDEVDVEVAKGHIVVHAKGEWHVNPDYPWKLSIGEAKLDRTAFKFDERAARIEGAPSGKGTIRGGICAGNRCKSFTEEVVIP